MIIHNKHTGQYIYEPKLIYGKVSVLWTTVEHIIKNDPL